LGNVEKRINITIHAGKEKCGSTMGLFGKALAPSVEGFFDRAEAVLKKNVWHNGFTC
jgi:hypothetical protein